MSTAANNVQATPAGASGATAALTRGIDWTGAFWVASGVPPLVLFSIGAVAAIVGNASWLVWTASIALGFIQSFTYAEIAGLFPEKSGGTSVYGAIAWVRYSKVVAPVSVWCYWMAWSPVQAIGSGLAAGYILSGLFEPDSVVNTWQLTLLDLATLTEQPLWNESRSVDDQVEWLDDQHVMYHLTGGSNAADIWRASVDGETPPTLVLPDAYSPAVLRTTQVVMQR